MGFLQPENLLYLLAVGALVLIYLRAHSRPTLDVSSIILFDEVKAPVTSARWLRVDLLFWLEAATLSALALAIAGLYLRIPTVPAHARLDALVFDLGAGMGARDGTGTRLDEARRQALAIVDSAPADERFSVIAYAMEAEMRHGPSADRPSIRSAIGSLRVLDVAARPAAFAAAIMRAQGADDIDLFADRAPSRDVMAQARSAGGWRFHRVGAAAENVGIASLDAGSVRSSQGHCVLKSFAAHPHLCELEIDCDKQRVLRTAVIVEPRGEVVVPFGPLSHGGLVSARILTPDALEADNQRWAYAQGDTPARVLIVSPDAGVRDDLARTLLAINENFIITAFAPANLPADRDFSDARLAVMHDFFDPKIRAHARLLIYPPSGVPGMRLTGTANLAALRAQAGRNEPADPLVVGPVRAFALPPWMSPTARGTIGSESLALPMAAIGYDHAGSVGLIAFDVRNHLLLDPDDLDALVLTVDLIRQLIAPEELRIVNTGAYINLPAGEPLVRVVAPDMIVHAIRPDVTGRVRFAALEAGRYSVESGDRTLEVMANYFDASESDLTSSAETSIAGKGAAASSSARSAAIEPRPLAAALLALAFAAFLAESIILTVRAWGRRGSNV
jgi:Aerotolerance regulator N-terminal